jgi:glycosyltransferase involved in cell wall biosynthesis
MKPIRVGVVCDFREEEWHSMDLIADMLMEILPAIAPQEISATRLCPPMARRWSRLPLVGRTARAHLGDRLTGRLWDYPRWLAPRTRDFDLFHIVDHSYAHLVRVLPPRRTIVTCNDTDALQTVLPDRNRRFDPARLLASGILDGLAQAAHIACISRTTQAQLLAFGAVDPARTSVVYLGVHPSCSPLPDGHADSDIAERLGPPGLEILHVGSTIPRKRIDVLLEILRGVRQTAAGVRLLRVGGSLTPAQRGLAKRLGVADAIVELPFMRRSELAALYRRASILVLPSDREGFGLPVVEAMACGTPVVASAIPALQEAGGSAAAYCPPGDSRRWVPTILELLRRKQCDVQAWEIGRRACITAAARFDWVAYADQMAQLYTRIGRPTLARMQAS